MRETVYNWAKEHVAPIAEKTDKENQFPMHLWKEMGKMGFLGVTAPGSSPNASLFVRAFLVTHIY
jgi:isovaleryl-CoA dehydrogenase